MTGGLVIRITTLSKPKYTVVTVDGRVTEADLKQLQQLREQLKGKVVLNLKGLDGCTAPGIQLFRDWLSSGARLEQATPFMEMVLETPASETKNTTKRK